MMQNISSTMHDVTQHKNLTGRWQTRAAALFECDSVTGANAHTVCVVMRSTLQGRLAGCRIATPCSASARRALPRIYGTWMNTVMQ